MPIQEPVRDQGSQWISGPMECVQPPERNFPSLSGTAHAILCVRERTKCVEREEASRFKLRQLVSIVAVFCAVLTFSCECKPDNVSPTTSRNSIRNGREQRRKLLDKQTMSFPESYKLLLRNTVLYQQFPATANGSVAFFKAIRKTVHKFTKVKFDPHLLFEMSDGSPVPSMTRMYCYPLFLTGLACRNETFFVEFGTWAGASTRCMALGLKLSKCTATFQALDAFQPSQLWKFRGSRFFNGRKTLDMLNVWKEIVWEVNREVQPLKGWIGKAQTEPLSQTWQENGISAFVIDSAKTHQQLVEQSVHVWEYLKIGAVVHLMDFAKTPQVELVYLLLKPQGYLSLVYMSFCSSPWTFVVEKRLKWSLIQQFSIKKVPCTTVVRGFNDIRNDIKSLSLRTRTEINLVQCTYDMISKRERRALTTCMH